jgi:hypothetical protein
VFINLHFCRLIACAKWSPVLLVTKQASQGRENIFVTTNKLFLTTSDIFKYVSHETNNHKQQSNS